MSVLHSLSLILYIYSIYTKIKKLPWLDWKLKQYFYSLTKTIILIIRKNNDSNSNNNNNDVDDNNFNSNDNNNNNNNHNHNQIFKIIFL